jgi:hypothetical protein
MRTKPHRGFDTLDPAEQRALAAKGGRSGHAQKKSHEWTREEAAAAGRKGGIAGARKRREQREAERIAEEAKS